jgi:hypothetical protein
VLDASDPRQTLLDAARRGDRVAVMAALKKLGLT